MYGAGRHGKKVADQLKQSGILIEGFLDSNKSGTIKCEDGNVYQIFSLDSIIKDKSSYQVIITIADYNERLKAAEQLNGIEIITREDVLKNDSYNIVENNRQYIADYHATIMEDYRVTFSTGTHARNYMSAQLFAYLANRAGLRIVQQKIIDWGTKKKAKNLDCITLLEKSEF